jgi:hypothetical protein
VSLDDGGGVDTGGLPVAGYSGTPLVRKLGIKLGHRVALVNPPPDFPATLTPLPSDVELCEDVRGSTRFDVIVFFAPDTASLRRRFDALARRLTPAGGLWVAWPKKSSGVPTDLSDGVVRTVGLDAGLVDNKVCAVDDVWSGLRFVIRVHDRPRLKARL